MIARINTVAFQDLEVVTTDVQVHIAQGLPSPSLIWSVPTNSIFPNVSVSCKLTHLTCRNTASEP